MSRQHPRRPAPPLLTAPLFAALLATASGCGDDLDPYSRLNRLRVLAIKSDPPVPALGEEARLSAFIYAPAGTPVTYAWSWCPLAGSANAGYPCIVTPEQLGALTGASGAMAPAADLGSSETAGLTLSAPIEALRSICDGGNQTAARLRLDCEGGFPVQVKLTVSTPTDRVDAVRTLRLGLEPAHAHTNPTLSGLRAVIGDAESPLDGSVPVEVLRRDDVVLKAALPETSAELYSGKDDDGRPAMLRERVFLTWFMEGGSGEADRTLFIDGVNGFDEATRLEWTTPTPKKYLPDTVRILVVARDNRGGVGWTEGSVKLGALKPIEDEKK